MEKKGWKIAAIIFIILLILETAGFIGLMVWGFSIISEEYDKEYDCVYNICSGADAYVYYKHEEICECYIDNELIKSEYMK